MMVPTFGVRECAGGREGVGGEGPAGVIDDGVDYVLLLSCL